MAENKDNNRNKNNGKNSKNNYQNSNDNKDNRNNKNQNTGNKKNKKWFNKKKQNSNKNYKKKKYYKKSRYKNKNITYEKCVICDKDIYQPLYAMKDKETGKNAHFECIQKIVLKDEKLRNNEKLYYLGGGAFGIVREKRIRGKLRFTIIKRLQYEERK